MIIVVYIWFNCLTMEFLFLMTSFNESGGGQLIPLEISCILTTPKSIKICIAKGIILNLTTFVILFIA